MIHGSQAVRCLGLATLLQLAASLGLEAQPIQVRGRVLRDEGHGVSGARVELFPAVEGCAESVRRLRESAAPTPLAAALTDADGAFRLAAPGSGGFRVEVRADGYLPMESPFLPLLEDAELSVQLPPAVPLEVRTLGSDGQPVAGIAVEIDSGGFQRPLPDDFPFFIRWQVAGRRGVSGPDGKVVLPRFPEEPPAVIALSPRFLGQRATGNPRDRGIDFRLSTRPTAKIEVRDGEGRPAADALVRWRGRPVAVTGPRGRTEIAQVDGQAIDVESAGGGWARVTPKPGSEVVAVRLLPRRRIAGKILDATNRTPLKDALVWVGRPPVAPAALSDAAGAFHLDAPPLEEALIEGRALGFLPEKPRSLRAGVAESVLLALIPAAAISGTVVDAEGRPIAGARVEIDPRRGGFEGGGAVDTGLDGRFRLTGLRPDSAYGLTATREGLAPRQAAARTAPAGQTPPPLRIVMDRGQTLSGRAAGEDGRPVAGATLALVDPETRQRVSQATSDAEGRFGFRHLAAGRLDLFARHPRHAQVHLAGIGIAAGGPPVDLTVTMPDGMAVEGRVTDTRGTPLAGAAVQATAESGDDSGFMAWGAEGGDGGARTGEDGGFRVEGLQRGALYSLSATRPGYAMASAPGVKAPTEEPVRIEMKEGRTLSGRVVGPEGEPVVGASLSWLEESRTGFGSSASSRSLGSTDADGRFQVPGLSPGDAADLLVQAAGYQPRRAGGVRIPEDRDLTDVKITLERAALIEVRVLNAGGDPVPEAWVRAEPGQQQPGMEPLPLSSFSSIEPDTTDADGRCRLSVEPGIYEVVAQTEDGRTLRRRVVARAASTPVELRFPPGVEVSGRVIGEDGAGLGYVGVTIARDRSEAFQAQTEADGAFRFSGVADGSYAVTAREHRSGRSSDPVRIVVAGEPVRDLELRLGSKGDGATLSGRLLGLAAEEIPQVQVAAFLDGVPRRGQVAREGSYRIDDLPPGEWRVQAYLPTGRAAQGTVRIEPGTPATLDLELPAGLTLSGRVLVDGAPLAGAEIQILRPDRGEPRMSRTAYDGRFTIQDIQPGDAFLLISGPGGIGGSRSVHITESLEMPVALSTGRLSGTVLTASGEPVEDAALDVEGWVPELKVPFSFTSARSGAEGAFEVPRLGAGTYRIVVRKNGFAPAEARAEVRPGGMTPVAIELRPEP